MAMALLCALLGASGLVVVFEGLDRRVKTVKDANLILPAPVCAAIPQALGSVTPKVLPRVAEYQPLSLHAEAYHFLALRLLNAQKEPIRSLMVVATKLGQGGTNTIANLGIGLAQAGKRVLIVDANVRTPQVHEVFGLPNEVGFTSLLQNPLDQEISSAVHQTSIPNLSVVTSGPPSSNPWGMLRSRRLVDLAERFTEMADYVLYDTPSAVSFTDALNLTPIMDAAFLCVRALEPITGLEAQLIDSLKEAHVTVLGSILTDVPAPLLETYANYQQYYPMAVRSALTAEEETPNGAGIHAERTASLALPGEESASRNGHGSDGVIESVRTEI
jgi:non-specific protein-tyrosine kinase